MTLEIAHPTKTDYQELLALNESCVPHVNSIDESEIAFFHQRAYCFVKIIENCRLAGFVIALVPGINYGSLNYQWFSRELTSFLYIDRIVVHPDFRRRGVATFLYSFLERKAVEAKIESLCCEVNLVPANPESVALHQRIGFKQRATQLTEGGAKEVSLLVKSLSAGGSV